MNTKKFIELNPKCCFCGGTVDAATIEHQPAKIIFPDKHRPKGLEFPSCLACNQQTARDEVLVALVARMGISPSGKDAGLDSKIDDIIKSINSLWPGLLPALLKTSEEHDARAGTSTIVLNHPQINDSIDRVCAKSALATYYYETGMIACEKSVVETKWAVDQQGTNAAASHLSDMLPKSAVLKQGKWDTTSTFFLRYHVQERFIYQATMLYGSIVLIAKLSIGSPPESWRPSMTRWFPSPGAGIVRYGATHCA